MWRTGRGEPIFIDRHDAGRRLAERLGRYRNERPIVLALPRGGVVVGYEVARALAAPLDVIVVRKIGAPGHGELGIGAIAPGGVRIIDRAAVRLLGVTRAQIGRIVAEEAVEMERRNREYRGGRPSPNLQGRTVILVDDGLATGLTARAAIACVRRAHPELVVLAAPVCAQQTAEALQPEADDLVCVEKPLNFIAVGLWYDDFEPTTDREVISLLNSSWQQTEGGEPGAPPPASQP